MSYDNMGVDEYIDYINEAAWLIQLRKKSRKIRCWKSSEFLAISF